MIDDTGQSQPRARFSFLHVKLWPIASIITIAGWFPVASVLLCSLIATSFDCQVDESRAHPCLVGPVDIGGALAVMGVMGWFFLVTFPLAAASVIIWPLLLVRWLYRRSRRAPA